MKMNRLVKEQVRNEMNRLSVECMDMYVSAYKLARKDNLYQSSWDEDDYTTHLVGYLEKLKLKNKWFVAAQKPYYTDQHYWGKVKSKHAPRPDLFFEKYMSFSSNKTFKFTIEAKNIAFNDSYLKARYIDTGIDNFKSQRYPNGCLACYVLKGSEDDNVNSLNLLLNNRNRKEELLVKHWFLTDFEFTYISNHNIGKLILELKHIFLEFNSI